MTMIENITDIDTQQELSEDNSKRILALITVNNQLDDVLVHIKTNGFTIIDSKHIQFSKEQSALFYQPYLEQAHEDSNVCALILEKENAIQEWKQWMDPTDKKEAPHSIFALLGHNVMYASDSNASAERDIAFLFHQALFIDKDKQEESPNFEETKEQEVKDQLELNEDTDALREIKSSEQVTNTSNDSEGQLHDTAMEQGNDVKQGRVKQDTFTKKDVQVRPSSSRLRIPVRIKRNQVDIPKQPAIAAQPLVNKATKSSRIARLSVPVKEPMKPAEKIAVTRVPPRVTALSNQKPTLSNPLPTKDGQTKKKTMPTKTFISRLTAPTVASANKNTKKISTSTSLN